MERPKQLLRPSRGGAPYRPLLFFSISVFWHIAAIKTFNSASSISSKASALEADDADGAGIAVVPMNDGKNILPSDAMAGYIRPINEARHERIEAHEKLRESQPYQAAIKHLDRMVADYSRAINAIDLMAARHPSFFDSLITLRVKSHLVQSMLAAVLLVKVGMLDPARRELRFLVEASVKTLWLDKGGDRGKDLPDAGNFDVASKVAALDDFGSRKFKEIVSKLEFGLLSDDAATTYRQTATDLYSKLSTYTHVSAANVERDLTNFDRDQPFGFETVQDVEAIGKLAKRVLDLALASHFEAFDHGLVGDILVNVFDDEQRWLFRKTPLVGAVDRYFDYKAERR